MGRRGWTQPREMSIIEIPHSVSMGKAIAALDRIRTHTLQNSSRHSMYIVRVHLYIYIYMHTCIYIHTCMCDDRELYIFTHMYIHTCMCDDRELYIYILAGMFVSGGRDGSIFVWDTRCSSKGEEPLICVHTLAYMNLRGHLYVCICIYIYVLNCLMLNQQVPSICQ